ncbi:flagellar hook protein FlgE [Sulfurimonas sp. HSL-1716]|uniref:flagellar hook protein FlgE n=1 Tax=Hydrocurvibacter sulfurireducens TaxID=3131937 RepID=UPI0031F888FE
MLKSLYSGVSGLQSHQIAMDVESNNIANVNTIGFKYSRANFSNLLAQVNQIATAPQGDLGGKNATQVGLGTTVSSMTRIHSQGSVQNTDKNTDCAIQGDGFFIVSGDAGKTLQYTRSGDFKFDASGNFVDNNGFVIQGWLRDEATGKVDSTAPITSISIPPGLTTPAKASTQITLKANLNSGDTVQTFSAIDGLDQFEQAVDLNRDGILDQSDSLATPQAVYDNTFYQSNPAVQGDGNAATNTDGISENSPTHIFTDSDGNIIERGEDMGIMTNGSGESFLLQSGSVPDQGQGEWMGFRTASVTSSTGGTAADGTTDAGALALSLGDINVNGFDVPAVTTAAANTSEDNAIAIAAAINTLSSKTGVTAIAVDTGSGSKDHIQLINDNTGTTKNIDVTVTVAGDPSGLASTDDDTPMKQFRYTDASVNAVGWDASASTYYFTTSEDLRQGMQTLMRNSLPTGGGVTDATNTADILAGTNHITTAGTGPYVTVDSTGKFQIHNPDTGGTNYDLNVLVTSIVDANTTENVKFNQTIQSISGALPTGSAGTRASQSFNVPTHSSSIDVFDSLGSKHTVKIDFRKSEFNPTTGSTWKVMITVPEPGVINIAGGATGMPTNIIEGAVTFGPDGSLSTFTPPSINFTANNGSTPNQSINLAVGTANAFDGLTSFDSKSATSGISQDGYTGGDLVGIRIDQSGTLVGSFSNGRSFGLAQIAMAKFANNEGLATEGGNIYSQSANSGDPIIGTAANGGRGFIQSSALEASNVDLSRALTQLIIIQRGFQANGKTITTSDQLLQTLIGLKQ